ncbi:allantoinase AllB [Phytomonospora sp. NPDC050363]|uniref:allantoinase AllB n=1 Tax=Phytomonospora sp. NPDC050363 TaxID=3155642 RepID=UPI0033C7DFD1
MTFDLVLRSRRAVLPAGEAPAAVGVRAGRIAAIGGYDDFLPAAQTVDLADDALLPGLVDTHVHINEPGRTEWEGFATATASAAAGGVTTLIDMPLNSLPPTVDAAALDVKRAAASGHCAVDTGFWGGAVPGNLGELAALHEAGAFGFKCFLSDSGVPEFPPLDQAGLLAAAREIARLGSVLLVHAEDPGALTAAPDSPRYRDFLASRPARAEVDAVARVIEAAEKTGARVHILHLSAAGAADLIADAKARGTAVTAETCPHFLVLDADEVPSGATEFKCCPPIRDAGNRDRLWAALADGTIDCVVSDHSPATEDLKRTGSFATAWGGISSLQLGLSLMWTEARRRGYGLAEVTAWMSTAPARLAGLDTTAGKGSIAVGNAADLVRFVPGETVTVDPLRLAHRNPVTPYAGRELTGRVRSTWLAGALPGAGRLLSREPARHLSPTPESGRS